MRVQRALAASAVVVVAGLGMTACQDDVTVSASTNGGQTASAASTGKASGGTGTTGSSSGGAGAKTPATGGAAAKDAACTTSNLIPDVSAGSPTPGADGNLTVTVSLVNKGDTCSLYGFAGVDLTLPNETTQVPRGFKTPGTVTLAKGEGGMFTISYRPSPKGHSGTKVTTMTITPPGETHSVKMNWPGDELAAGADAGGTDTLYLEPVVKH
ncbi:DUF4232 domain-containing protein [Kitasatospora sp. NBC_01250]|uniref:hypothetical protein n=1 Tax=unclassified Kitasatospora TaxID=2633591 RepID=UPI002E14774D|nr:MULTISPECIES: hypothetical protein [unclassified Kitasatospora]WSJ70789.1 DUF4232 domain-containing protein [Kitasatospora sp. NBC_01302]